MLHRLNDAAFFALRSDATRDAFDVNLRKSDEKKGDIPPGVDRPVSISMYSISTRVNMSPAP